MSPIPLKSIVSVSSEDPSDPASNLLSPVHGGKWLCQTGNKSRIAEVVVELSKRARIAALEIINFGSAFVEVLVSDTGDLDQTDVTLLHMSMLMTYQESRTGRNRNKMAVYGKDKLAASATCRKWNRVKIRCVQKHDLKTQFGLRSISFFADSHNPEVALERGVTSPRLCKPLTAKSAAPKHEQTHSSKQQQLKLPSLPSSSIPHNSRTGGDEGVTPKSDRAKRQPSSRTRSEEKSTTDTDFEFSGVEKQSRLFRDCLHGPEGSEDKTTPTGSNPILERISADKEKYRESLNPLYPRKRLLKRKLPKAEGKRDFAQSYKDSKSISNEMSGACRRMSSHDNNYEIGEEPENTWGWGKSRKQRPHGNRGKRVSHKETGWIRKRKKLDSMIEHCSDILKKAGHGHVTSLGDCEKEEVSEKENVNSGGCGLDAALPTHSHVEDSSSCPPPSDPSTVECPLCSSFFPSYAIEVHASQCGDQERPSATPPSLHALDMGGVVITID